MNFHYTFASLYIYIYIYIYMYIYIYIWREVYGELRGAVTGGPGKRDEVQFFKEPSCVFISLSHKLSHDTCHR